MWNTIITNPLHFIIFSAPFVLSLTFAAIGRFHALQNTHLRSADEAKQANWELANVDSLTGCGNRLNLFNKMSEEIKGAENVFLLLMDLDKFKNVNDALGHHVGDQLLICFSRRVNGLLPDTAELYRLGGDEFVVLMSDCSDQETAESVARDILASFVEPFDIEQTRVVSGASIGIAAMEPAEENPNEVFLRADLALYAAKEEFGNTYSVFCDDMQNAARLRLDIERDLRLALERNELFLEFQPIYDLDRLEAKCAEALVRWRHPVRGVLAPSHFIEVAEVSGLIIQLGEKVLRLACAAAVEWRAGASVAVNVSAEQFKNRNFYDQVVRILQETGLHADRLVLEITESLFIKDMDLTANTFDRLKELGIRFALDDFGTGYSSISHLRKLNLDYLKLDKSFTDNMAGNRMDRELVSSVIGLGKVLNLTTTVEGVEHQEQIDALRRYGADQVQGFYLARPMSESAIAALFADAAISAEANQEMPIAVAV